MNLKLHLMINLLTKHIKNLKETVPKFSQLNPDEPLAEILLSAENEFSVSPEMKKPFAQAKGFWLCRDDRI